MISQGQSFTEGFTIPWNFIQLTGTNAGAAVACCRSTSLCAGMLGPCWPEPKAYHHRKCVIPGKVATTACNILCNVYLDLSLYPHSLDLMLYSLVGTSLLLGERPTRR